MTSRKKANGCTSARRVEKAIRKSGCTLEEFFRRAVRERGGCDFDADAAVKSFRDFKERGLADPYYGIPKFVIALAEEVLREKRRRVPSRKNHLKTTRPSISMGS